MPLCPGGLEMVGVATEEEEGEEEGGEEEGKEEEEEGE